MFAYCQNKPTMYEDSSGCAIKPNTMYINDGAGGTPGPIGIFSNEDWQTLDAYNNEPSTKRSARLNTDAQEVINAKKFAYYNGVPVFKVSFMGNSAFSCGAIFMGSDITNPNLVRHEYGHVQQLREIGLMDYLSMVVVPSVTGFIAMQLGVVPAEHYYDQPWEYKADEYGQPSWGHSSWAKPLSDVYWKIANKIAGVTPY